MALGGMQREEGSLIGEANQQREVTAENTPTPTLSTLDSGVWCLPGLTARIFNSVNYSESQSQNHSDSLMT